MNNCRNSRSQEYEQIFTSDYDSLLLTAPALRMKIEFRNVSYNAKFGRNHKRSILNNIHGTIHPGELTAIIGPSGAGKTTLLNILAGYKTCISSGEIYVNGQPRDNESFRRCCAYIMQEDCILPNLTVLESMKVSARLRLQTPSEKYIDVNQRINEILKTLGLEDVARSNVCNVSGGQRKRISIALELVSNPPVIFLDEPTSGLDSHSAYQCINLMNSLVQQGRTICCTIHQPSARLFELFHKVFNQVEQVIVLVNGSVLFEGPINDMIPYFASLNIICPKYHNPADFILEVASGYYGVNVETICNSWKNSGYQPEVSIGTSNADISDKTRIRQSLENIINTDGDNSYSHKPTDYKQQSSKKALLFHEVVQFYILTKRSIKAMLRDKMFTYLRLVTTIAMALLLGSLYFNIGNDGINTINNLGCIFFTLIYLIFICLMPTVLTFPSEKNVFIREHLNNWYSLKVYYLSKTVSDLPFQILLPIMYTVIMYYMSGQPLQIDRFCRFLLVIVMSVMVSQSIGLLLGALAPNSSVAVFVAPVSGIPLLLFCGYFVKFSVIPIYLRWLTYVSYARYSWEGLILSLYGYDRGDLDCQPPHICMFSNGNDVLNFLDIKEDAMGIKKFRFWFCVIILNFFFVALRLLSYLILKRTVSSKKK